jgi:hypothetical protein
MYWGMELGLGSRGASASGEYIYDDGEEFEKVKEHIATWNAKFSPFTIGYKYALNETIKLDAHLGGFVSYDFAGSGKADWTTSKEDPETDKCDFSEIKDDYYFECFDAGVQFGVGVWYKNFNFDITYQRGFINASEANELDGNSVYSSNLMLRVGMAF